MQNINSKESDKLCSENAAQSRSRQSSGMNPNSQYQHYMQTVQTVTDNEGSMVNRYDHENKM